MRPKFSEQGQQAMNRLTSSTPQNCDPFERMVGGKITGLSMDLERLNAQAAALREDLATTEQTLTESVGEYQGWVEALAGYYQSQQTGQRTPVAADGGRMPGQPEPTTPEPTPAVTEAGDTGATDQGDHPPGKPNGGPQEVADSGGPDSPVTPAPDAGDESGKPKD